MPRAKSKRWWRCGLPVGNRERSPCAGAGFSFPPTTPVLAAVLGGSHGMAGKYAVRYADPIEAWL